MGLGSRCAVVWLPLIAGFAASFSVQAQNVRSTALAVGSGSGQIGLIMRANEECRGPASVTPASAGKLAVLDKVNRKIVVIGAASEDVRLPGDLVEPADLIATTRGYVVVGVLGDLVVVDQKGIVLARTKTPHNPEGGAVRLVALTAGGFALEDVRGNRTRVELARAQTGDLIVPGLATAGAYTLLARSNANEVTIGSEAIRGPLASITLASRMRIVNARAIWVDERAGALVAVQESRQLPEEAAFVRLVTINAGGRPTSEAYLGPEAFACDTRRPFARLTDGRVVNLAFYGRNELALDVLSFEPVGTSAPKVLGRRSDAILISEESENALNALERLNGTPSVSTISLTSISPEQILERARAALQLKWHLASANFSHLDVPNRCDPPMFIWRRPSRLDVMLGHEVAAIPYRWGGYVRTVDAFRDHLSAGWLAGDDCTCRVGNCVYAKATGLDCSGFVSYAWQIGNYFTTVSLPSPSISNPVAWVDLAPSDIVNKPGNHVRLVESISSGPTGRIVTVIESTTRESCGGICRWAYTEIELRQAGYKPLRRIALTN